MLSNAKIPENVQVFAEGAPVTEAAKEVVAKEQKIIPPTVKEPVAEVKVEPTTTEKVVEKEQPKKEEIKVEAPKFNEAEYLKNNLGFNSLEEAKKQIEELKQKSEQKSIFNPEDKEKFFEEVYTSMQKKKELSELEKLSPKDKIKLDIKYKNPDYTQEEVDFSFNEKYEIPEKPEQEEDELEDAYLKRVAKWDKEVKKIETRIGIASKEATKDLQKINSELVLPDIKGQQSIPQDNGDYARIRKAYEDSLNSDYKNFNGFSTTYKDKDVEIPISYSISDEEKELTKAGLHQMDVDEYFGNRWFAEDGKPKIAQQMHDKYILENFQQILDKIANDSGGRVLDHYIRERKNIHLTDENARVVETQDPRNTLRSLQEQRFGKKVG